MARIDDNRSIRDSSRYNDDDLADQANRRARARSAAAKPFPPIADPRDEVKNLRKKAMDSEKPDSSDDTDTIAANDAEIPSDAPVYNTRQSKQQDSGQDLFQGDSSKFQASYNEVNESAKHNARAKRTNASTPHDSPFALYKDLSSKNASSTAKSAPSPMKNLDKNNAEANIENISSDNQLPDGLEEPIVPGEQTGELAQLFSEDSVPSEKRKVANIMSLAAGLVEAEKVLHEQIAVEKSFVGKDIASTDAPPLKESKRAAEKKGLRNQSVNKEADVINPFASGAQIGLAHVGRDSTGVTDAAPANQLLKVIEQIVSELHNIEHQGYTDTIILLNQPPMFQNSRVVITSFDSATKEFNLSFEGLTGAAKKVLDLNMDSLRESLLNEGYANAIHIVTTTTTIEHHIPSEFVQREKDRENRNQQQQQQNQEKPNEDESEFDA